MEQRQKAKPVKRCNNKRPRNDTKEQIMQCIIGKCFLWNPSRVSGRSMFRGIYQLKTSQLNGILS